jgi:hypothetical protein
VLRVGMNKLKSRDDIVYLRKLPNLRSTVRWLQKCFILKKFSFSLK